MTARAIAARRSRLTLQVPVDVTDDNGGVSRSFVALADLWGEIVPAGANDRFLAQRMEETISHRIRIRFRPDLTAAMRLVVGSRVFLIHGIEDEDERHRFSRCHCEEVRP